MSRIVKYIKANGAETDSKNAQSVVITYDDRTDGGPQYVHKTFSRQLHGLEQNVTNDTYRKAYVTKSQCKMIWTIIYHSHHRLDGPAVIINDHYCVDGKDIQAQSTYYIINGTDIAMEHYDKVRTMIALGLEKI
jgi:hypothetical protein